MASPQASQKIGANLYAKAWDHDPGVNTALICSPDGGTTKRYVDMSQYGHFAVLAVDQALTGAGITKVEIVACADTAFSSVTVIKDSGTVAADAMDDQVFLECSAEEIAQEGADAGVELRYAAARLTLANAADEARVVYIALPKHPAKDTTVTAIA